MAAASVGTDVVRFLWDHVNVAVARNEADIHDPDGAIRYHLHHMTQALNGVSQERVMEIERMAQSMTSHTQDVSAARDQTRARPGAMDPPPIFLQSQLPLTINAPRAAVPPYQPQAPITRPMVGMLPLPQPPPAYPPEPFAAILSAPPPTHPHAIEELTRLQQMVQGPTAAIPLPNLLAYAERPDRIMQQPQFAHQPPPAAPVLQYSPLILPNGMVYTPTHPAGQPIRSFLSEFDDNTLRNMVQRSVAPTVHDPSAPSPHVLNTGAQPASNPCLGDSRRTPVDLTAEPRRERRVDFMDDEVDRARFAPPARRGARIQEDTTDSEEDLSDEENLRGYQRLNRPRPARIPEPRPLALHPDPNVPPAENDILLRQELGVWARSMNLYLPGCDRCDWGNIAMGKLTGHALNMATGHFDNVTVTWKHLLAYLKDLVQPREMVQDDLAMEALNFDYITECWRGRTAAQGPMTLRWAVERHERLIRNCRDASTPADEGFVALTIRARLPDQIRSRINLDSILSRSRSLRDLKTFLWGGELQREFNALLLNHLRVTQQRQPANPPNEDRNARRALFNNIQAAQPIRRQRTVSPPARHQHSPRRSRRSRSPPRGRRSRSPPRGRRSRSPRRHNQSASPRRNKRSRSRSTSWDRHRAHRPRVEQRPEPQTRQYVPQLRRQQAARAPWNPDSVPQALREPRGQASTHFYWSRRHPLNAMLAARDGKYCVLCRDPNHTFFGCPRRAELRFNEDYFFYPREYRTMIRQQAPGMVAAAVAPENA